MIGRAFSMTVALMEIELICAPSNLGLRPLREGHVPGTWRAPEALLAAGLLEAVSPDRVTALGRPVYSPAAQPGTRLYNGPAMRAFNLLLADSVEEARRHRRFPLVIGGDCSVLLGALAGVRRESRVSLVHIDGHSDFRHPGNYDPEARRGAVAGMDLALATGRGERLMTEWPGVEGPLIADDHAVQLGERENRNADFAWPDVNDTAINRIDVFEARAKGPRAVLSSIRETIGKQPDWPFWVHLDVDVLDQEIMPAVDSPGSPGVDPDDIVLIGNDLANDSRCCGMTVTVFDPDLDPNGECASLIVSLLGRIFRKQR